MHPTSEMMSKCRKWHLREPKFAKFHEGACPQTPLEARAFGARVSASGAKKYLPKHNRTPLNRIHPTGLLCSEGRTESDSKGLVCYYSIKACRVFGFGAPALKCFDLFGIEYKILDFSRP